MWSVHHYNIDIGVTDLAIFLNAIPSIVAQKH